jgi:alkaline phosphatase D
MEQDMAPPRLCRRLLGILLSATLTWAMLTSAAPAEVVFGGIAAGDMSTAEAVLWVRAAENSGGGTNLSADVATDADFANIVAALHGATSRDSDFTLKLQVGALTPHTRYFYRFRTSDGVTSPTGQFSTAPAPN